LQRQFTLLPWCCGKKPHFLFYYYFDFDFLILMVGGQGLLNFLNSTQLRPKYNLRQGGVLAQHVGRYSCRQEVAGLTPDRGAAA